MNTVPTPPPVEVPAADDDWTSRLTHEQRLQKIRQGARARAMLDGTMSILKQVCIKVIQDYANPQFEEPDRYWESLIEACCEARGIGVSAPRVLEQLHMNMCPDMIPGDPNAFDHAYNILVN